MYPLYNIIKYRLLIMYKSKTMIGLTCLVVGLFALLTSTLYKEAKDSSQIAVAVVDQDKSPMTKRILGHLYEDDVLRPIEASQSEGMTLLKNDSVQAVYVLTEDFQEQVNNENYVDIIQVYYAKGNTVSKFIGDLFAEKVLRELCLIKSLNIYERVLDQHTIDNKEKHLKKAFESGVAMQDYSNNGSYVKVEFTQYNNTMKARNVDKTLLYKKMILGMMLSFIAFYILFASIGIVKEKESYIASRLDVTSTNPVTVVLGHYISLVLAGSLVSVIFGGISQVYGGNFYYIVTALILFTMSISALILCFTHIVHTVSNHMLILSIIILMMGVMSGSFFSIDVITSELRYLTYMIPHVWTLDTLLNQLAFANNDGMHLGYIWYSLLYSGIFLGVTCILKLYKLK